MPPRERDNSNNNGSSIPIPIGPQPSTQIATQHPLCTRHEQECARKWDEVSSSMRSLESSMVEHKLRLENGTKVFADIKAELGEVKKKIESVEKAAQPKPTDWTRIVIFGFTVLVAILSGWWGLSTKFSDRPTKDEVDKVMSTHSLSDGHPSLSVSVKAVHDEQIKQGIAIGVLSDKLDENKKDLKEIKDAIKNRGGR